MSIDDTDRAKCDVDADHDHDPALDDLPDGCGCVEVWEWISERRQEGE